MCSEGCIYACKEIRAELHILYTVLRFFTHLEKVIQNAKQGYKFPIDIKAFKRYVRNHGVLLHQGLFELSVTLSHTIFNAASLSAK